MKIQNKSPNVYNLLQILNRSLKYKFLKIVI